MRKILTVTITNDNRDRGKKFKIHEMSAFESEKWASCAINSLIRSSPMAVSDVISDAATAFVLSINKPKQQENIEFAEEINEKLIDFSMESLATVFASQFFNAPNAEYDELSSKLLWQCEAFKMLDTNGVEIYEKLDPENIDIYIEEASTIYTLKREAFKLHTDFFINESAPDLKLYFMQARIRQKALEVLSQNQSISPEPSA